MAYRAVFNRPFPSTLVPLFQNESKCETFHMKISSARSSIFMQIKVIFLRLVSHLDSISNRGTRELKISLESVVKPKPKWLLWPITKDTDSLMNQSKFEVTTCSWPKRRKTCVNESRLVQVLFLIRRERGERILCQSCSGSSSTMDGTLSRVSGLCGSMIPRAVLTGVHTPGSFNHVREVLSESLAKTVRQFPDLQHQVGQRSSNPFP